ncbi:cobalt ECF transporter T component CbiQ [Thiocapsa marina]|uniref:Cobalt ABC transporter, inner membrane subunit CbiQ n=1 Tax=Thiocapsa marina 5811 TaxID=768671 RepID=F9UFE0_9GAMM|nr:cobalt ECF transporter T component CbiQ [Thiocapsa marina]EGV17177.1 cobalt ABC transporter, inner membrane subunit CbiQ [Thiocapsa marina 5811]
MHILDALSDRAGHGSLRTLDPRLRIIAAALFALVVVSLSGLATLFTALGLALSVMLAARLPARPTLQRIAAMDGFMLMILVLLPLTVPGTPILEWGGFTASAEGLIKAVEILLKANAVVLVLLALVGSLDAVTLGHALARLRMPSNLVQLLFFTVRYIGVIGEEYARLRTAMRARGFRPANSLHTYRSIGYLVGMLLVRSLERSERILAAMRCRGFEGRFHLLDDFAYGRSDALFAGLTAVACTGLLIMDLTYAAAV